MPGPDRRLLVPTRRVFLGGLAAAGLVAACGDDDGGSGTGAQRDGGSGTGGSGDGFVGGLSAVRFFGPYFAAGTAARVPFGLSDDEGLLGLEQSPIEIVARVVDPDGAELVGEQVVRRRDDGLPRPYYPVRFVPEVAGFHDVYLDTPAGEILTQMQVVAADDPVASGVVAPGDPMPALDTPTTAVPGPVDPICTRTPACDLHQSTVADLVGNGRPTAILVATPAFCQTVVCGPILDLLLDLLPDRPGIDAVHLEVYRDPADNSVPPTLDEFAPVIAELGLPFEPVLFAVDTDGVVADRLDYVFDRSEMAEVLDALSA